MADFSNGQTPNMQLATKFELGKVQFEGYLEKNQNKSFLYAKSASETTVDLIKLANSFLPEGVNLPKDLPFEFTNLFLSVCSKGELNFRAQTVSSWEITEDFTIHSGKLNLKLIKNPSTHERAFTGLIEGKSKLFDIDTTVKVTIAEQLKMSVIVPEIKLDNLLARYAANLELPSEFPLKDLILKNLEVNIIPLTGEMSFKGNSTSTFQMPLGGANIEFTNVEFYLSLDQDQQIGCNIQVKGKSILNPELKLDEFELILDFKNDKWSIEGATDMYMLETKTSLGVTILKEKSKSLLSLKSKLKLPIKLSQLLKSIGIENNALPEDLTHLDAELESLEFTIDNHKKINFIGGVSLTNQSNLQIGEEVLPLASFHFDIQILDEETEVKLSLKGGNLPQLASIDAQIKSYLFQFEINKRKENTFIPF